MKDYMGKEIKVGSKVTYPVGKAGMLTLELREVIEVGRNYVKTKTLRPEPICCGRWHKASRIKRTDLMVIVEE